MLETTIGQSSEQDEEEQDDKPLNLSTQIPPPYEFYRDRIYGKIR